MLTKIALDKENAWACLAAQFSKSIGKQTSVLQMKKTCKQYEISCKKTYVNATGNNAIKLFSWPLSVNTCNFFISVTSHLNVYCCFAFSVHIFIAEFRRFHYMHESATYNTNGSWNEESNQSWPYPYLL